jgi:hypothetical protein
MLFPARGPQKHAKSPQMTLAAIGKGRKTKKKKETVTAATVMEYPRQFSVFTRK